ncbi:MAG TPA: response regulator [Bryobacteraceae bacterium]|jgi:DNA-binding response OmpR family regulator|nr:response regulator [Bryobacteraceae bacterium]
MKVLAVEDNYADIHWLKMVLDRMGVVYTLSVVTDGQKAVDFLLKRGDFAEAPDPDLVLLDLNLPKLSGLEVLKAVPHSDKLPVCIITGSPDEREQVMRKFGIRRIAYVVKPVDRDRLLNCFRCYDHLRPYAEELARC